jgi:hypothetical protein
MSEQQRPSNPRVLPTTELEWIAQALEDADKALAVLFTMCSKQKLMQGAVVADEIRADVQSAMKNVAHLRAAVEPLARSAPDVPHAALARLSQAMGNPAVEWREDQSIEEGLIDEAIRRLTEPPKTDIEALLDSFVWAVRRDNDAGDQYTRQEVKDVRAELLAAIRATVPPGTELELLRARIGTIEIMSRSDNPTKAVRRIGELCREVLGYSAVTKGAE